jgi:hypothetical protein
MLTYLLEKLDKIKKDRDLYCSTKQNEPKTKEEETKIEKKKETHLLYELICK